MAKGRTKREWARRLSDAMKSRAPANTIQKLRGKVRRQRNPAPMPMSVMATV